ILHERPEECARETLTRRQKIAAAAGVVVLAGLLAWRPVTTLIALNGLAIVFYAVGFIPLLVLPLVFARTMPPAGAGGASGEPTRRDGEAPP
ncbi:MAG: hypothetical protein U9Q74_00250, partial [Gemmatimonadota bacterium]|nr:hypothetical protein [Gemmatimonadota bacterium]